MHEFLNDLLDQQRTDEVAGTIEACVQHRLAGRVLGFHVEVRDRGLVLQGRTRTYYAKQLVQHETIKLAGLPIVANEVEVL